MTDEHRFRGTVRELASMNLKHSTINHLFTNGFSVLGRLNQDSRIPCRTHEMFSSGSSFLIFYCCLQIEDPNGNVIIRSKETPRLADMHLPGHELPGHTVSLPCTRYQIPHQKLEWLVVWAVNIGHDRWRSQHPFQLLVVKLLPHCLRP